MQSIISLLDKKESISNEISRLQRTQQTITEQVKDYVDNLSPEKKRFLDDKILSTFDEKTIEHIEAYRKYMKDGKDGIFIYFNDGTGDQLKIENTKELYDIFGEEALHKIYDYIVNH